MTFMTYAQQLKHPNWQRRRLERLSEAEFSCEDCGETDLTLHVHHRSYVKGRRAWEYNNDELEVLCEVCHEKFHKAEAVVLSLLAGENRGELFGLVAGYMAKHMSEAELNSLIFAGCGAARLAGMSAKEGGRDG